MSITEAKAAATEIAANPAGYNEKSLAVARCLLSLTSGGDEERARELVAAVRKQNWKAGGCLSMDNDEAEAMLTALAAAVRAEEREACAKIADPPLMHRAGRIGLWRTRRAAIATAIRERGNG